MRNVFDQYLQPENKLTHALVCSLGQDPRLLRRFVRWATGRSAPGRKLHIVEQQRPGEPERSEGEAAGIPDAWIFDDEGWALLIESKVSARVATSQLRRHMATAIRRGFPNPILLTLTARGESHRIRGSVVPRAWTEVYSWLLKERSQSEWAGRCVSYMEILEALRLGGAFHYVPALPFLEELLPAERFRVERQLLPEGLRTGFLPFEEALGDERVTRSSRVVRIAD